MPNPYQGPQPGEAMKRRPANKHRSAKQFRRNVSRTKAINVIPMRGGYRL